MDAIIIPGSVNAAVLAMQIFPGKVNPGHFHTPVYIEDITEEEYVAGRELLKEAGHNMKARYLHEEVT